jgi:hypothetical protein
MAEACIALDRVVAAIITWKSSLKYVMSRSFETHILLVMVAGSLTCKWASKADVMAAASRFFINNLLCSLLIS